MRVMKYRALLYLTTRSPSLVRFRPEADIPHIDASLRHIASIFNDAESCYTGGGPFESTPD